MKNILRFLKRIIPMLALAVMVMAPNWGWGQESVIYTTGFESTEGFTASTTYNNTEINYAGEVGKQWGTYYGTASTTGPISGSQSMQMRWYSSASSNLGYTFTNFDLANVTSVSFKAANTSSVNVIVSYSTDGGNAFINPQTYTLSTTTDTYTYSVSATGEFPSVRIKFQMTNATVDKSRLYIDDVAVSGITSAPTITVDPTILTGFTYIEGSGPSAEQTFTVSGSNLTNDISIVPPANYEISTATGGSFVATSPIVLTQSSGTVAETTIYVRLKAGLTAGDYNGEEITATSTGAADKTVSCSGSVTAPPDPEPTNHATEFTVAVATPAYSAIDVTWVDATGGTVPEGYVIKASDVGYGSITPPTDGTEQTPGTLIKVVNAGVQTANFTGLDGNTAYYFKIWPYTNSGTAIDYKTDGTVPEATATTDAPIVYDNVETFDNFGATGTSYSSGTFLGQDGSTWTFIESRGDKEITGKALMVGKDRTPQSEVYSGTISGGIQVLNFDYMQAFSTDVNLNVLVNDVVVGNVTSTSELNVVKNSGDISVNVSGNFVLKFINVNNSDGQVVIDNISWNSISAFSAYTGTGNWSEVGNWNNGIPDASTDAIIHGNVTVDNTAECKDITISPLGAVTVGAGQKLTVNGNFLIESNATGTGSFIGAAADYTITGTKTIQRYLTGGWVDGWDAGWHQISSPVAAQVISAFETTGVSNGYDFYGWEESTSLWMNYKDVGFEAWNGNTTNFNIGQGYMVSYEAANITQTFTGVLNTASVTKTNLSYNVGTGNGWHLLGNPFASALTWNDGNWALSNVAGGAKIWNEAGKSYSDIAASGIIPSAQGFMVQLSNTTNSITIPAASRVHNAAAFYKSGNEQLLLVAAETEGGSAQESKIIVNPMATEGFDFDYDSRFLAGYAPLFYSVVGDELLSTNSLPELNSAKTIPFGFVKNAATAFTIELKESIPGRVVYLTDVQTGAVTNLSETPEYNFTSDEGDDADRFTISFGFLGINNPEATDGVHVYAHDGVLYLETLSKEVAQFKVYNLSGQLVMQGRTGGNALSTFNVSALGTGVYVVNVILNQGTVSQKLVIRK